MGLLKAFIPICLLSYAVSSLPQFSFEEIRYFKEWMITVTEIQTVCLAVKRIELGHQSNPRSTKKTMAQKSMSTGSRLSFKTRERLMLITEVDTPFKNCSATQGNHYRSADILPENVDWRKRGNYITPVKNQGGCGSCWTFSTTGCLESVIAIKSGKLVSLAEQQLVDCAQNFKNHGCAGGLPSQAFEYIKYNNGLETEQDYPYEGKDGTCRFERSKAAAFVKDVVNITQYDEDGMVDAVARLNPVSFAFQVTDDFLLYTEGVYSNPNCSSTPDKVNHAVLAVGYGVSKGTKYWIVKNSWGTSWGIDGYFYIERGKNMCGLAACASYPIPLF